MTLRMESDYDACTIRYFNDDQEIDKNEYSKRLAVEELTKKQSKHSANYATLKAFPKNKNIVIYYDDDILYGYVIGYHTDADFLIHLFVETIRQDARLVLNPYCKDYTVEPI